MIYLYLFGTCFHFIYVFMIIGKVSGFSSRSSVFRILNKFGVDLNRGKFKGPLGKRQSKE